MENEKKDIVYLYSDCSEICDNPAEIYTEFDGEIATRQINISCGEMIASSKSDILYDGKKSDLDFSFIQEIDKAKFEEAWVKAKGESYIEYSNGDASESLGKNFIICHVVNNKKKWGKGFVLSLEKKIPGAKKSYINFFSETNENNVLGYVDFYSRNDVFVASLFAQDGIRKNVKDKGVYISYESLKRSLNIVRYFCLLNRKSIQMPRIGAGLAGGDWGIIAKIIQNHICYYGIRCVVIDLE